MRHSLPNSVPPTIPPGRRLTNTTRHCPMATDERTNEEGRRACRMCDPNKVETNKTPPSKVAEHTAALVAARAQFRAWKHEQTQRAESVIGDLDDPLCLLSPSVLLRL